MCQTLQPMHRMQLLPPTNMWVCSSGLGAKLHESMCKLNGLLVICCRVKGQGTAMTHTGGRQEQHYPIHGASTEESYVFNPGVSIATAIVEMPMSFAT